jgi:DNA polymerase zeta
VECHAFDDERALLRGFVATVLALDPDVLIGFEVQGESLGFLADRARRLDVDLLRHVSRSESVPGANERQDDEYGRLHASGIYVTGRIVLNLWRVLRGELKLQSYAFESCVSAVLGRRVPKFSAKTLSRWAVGGDDDSSREKKKKRETNVREGGEDANHDDSNKKKKKPPSSHQRWRAIHHVCARALLVSKMCEQLDVVARTNEQAKIFGIDFQSVVFRGSQYRVESMMLRLAHLENYLAPSPSAEQTSRQPAMECLPLVMEPESKLYVDPVAVLDFASLYPSVVCAYNLCYSTCLGKVPDQRDLDAMFDETGDEKEKASLTGLRADQVAGLGGGPPRKLGCHELALPPGLLPAMLRASHKNGARRPSDADGEPEPAPRSENPPGVTVTPNGVMFAPKNVRPGILPRLLAEILDTRAMVKSCLKHAPADAKARRRALNAKQFGLKLIANVTYGYTAAGFSGRMPMAELADAIVQCGRDTLERAIRTVHSGDARWRGARVVYGDTDSLFVHFPGYSKASAFDAAAAIAAAVTADNPDPVTLKLEKVYHPCILATKKRYVGHAYESPTQRAPLFDAKGIEVARRDNCPLLVKTQRVALQLLFHNKDLSLVKRYVQRHVAKLRAGRIPLGDLVFAKETRLGTYSKTPGAQKPPAAIVAESLMARDPRAEPKFGERVPYVVVCGEPGGRLMDMIAHPRAVAEARGTLRINAKYYGDKGHRAGHAEAVGAGGRRRQRVAPRARRARVGERFRQKSLRGAARVDVRVKLAFRKRAETPISSSEHRSVFPERAVRGLRRAHRGAENRMRRVRFESWRGGGDAGVARGGARTRRRETRSRVPGVRRWRRSGHARGVRVQGMRRVHQWWRSGKRTRARGLALGGRRRVRLAGLRFVLPPPQDGDGVARGGGARGRGVSAGGGAGRNEVGNT